MGWRFRQSFTVIPGLRLSLSKSGLSASIGRSPFTLNVGPMASKVPFQFLELASRTVGVYVLSVQLGI